jgi:copper resistance protein B
MIACVLAIAIAAAQQPPHTHPPATPPAAQTPAPKKPPAEDHSAQQAKPPDKPKEPIPPITDADRAAAFPADLQGHAVHDRGLRYFVLFDQLEWQGSDTGGANLENTSWIGGDVNRLWLRAEGESDDGRVENAFVHALWGHSFSRWWDVVAGVRQDFRPGDPQTWAAVGIQGLAPYWFEIEATGYVGSGGRTHARVEAEYELLLTNRLILQPLAELEIYGKSDPARGLGAGLSSLETGLRLRYEHRREFAPYLGVTWQRKFFGTADFAREEGERIGGARLAFGIRTWF